MTQKHTPGPWFFHRDELLHERHPHGSYDLIADVDQDDNGLDWQTNEANARLIAAAPETKAQRDELLEALEALRACVMETRGPDAHQAVKAADAAIAKAKGEAG